MPESSIHKNNLPIRIIGAGLGGLSAAIHLASRGFKVAVYERNLKPGGKMNQRIIGNYRFDTGPSLLTMPFVIDQLFSDAGIEREAILDIEPIQPLCRYFWNDGSTMDALKDVDAMVGEIAGICRKDALNYRAFLEYSQRIYQITADIFLHTPIHELDKLLRKNILQRFLKLYQIDPFRTVHQGIARYFKHPKLQQLFDRYATYNGSDPFQAPATLNIIPFVELGIGGYYIRGGMYKLIEALVETARSMGVEIHLNRNVEEILHKNGRVSGIQVDGQKLDARVVLCNADVVWAYQNLINGFKSRRQRFEKLEPSISGMVFLWGINKQTPKLAHHNIFFSENYRQEFRDIFQNISAAQDPTVYLAITSKTDPSHAPAGAENWFILINIPYLTTGQNWPHLVNQMRDFLKRRFSQIGIDISESIEVEQVFTPEDFLKLYSSNRGSIYGISSNSRKTAFRRPPNRSRDIAGLYFAGGSTHPGGGIPLALLSGKMAAGLALENELKSLTPRKTILKKQAVEHFE